MMRNGFRRHHSHVHPGSGFLGRWMWPVKRLIAPLRAKITGPPKLIDLRGTVLEIEPGQRLPLSAAETTLTNASGEALFVFNDLSFEAALKATPGVQVLTTPRMNVANGMQSQMAITQSAAIGSGTNVTFQPVGWWLDVWPFARGRAVELACFLTSTERALRETGNDESLRREAFIRTNVAFGARVMVPTNGLVFLLSRSTNQKGKVLGALLSPGILKN